MKRLFLFLGIYLCVSLFIFSTDSILGEGSGKRVVIISHGHTNPHLIMPTVAYYPQSSTITIDFGNQPIEDYSVTISSPFTDVDYYVTSSFTTIPLVVDGISDYTIIIETCDGDIFEGTLAASEYSTTVTM